VVEISTEEAVAPRPSAALPVQVEPLVP